MGLVVRRTRFHRFSIFEPFYRRFWSTLSFAVEGHWFVFCHYRIRGMFCYSWRSILCWKYKKVSMVEKSKNIQWNTVTRMTPFIWNMKSSMKYIILHYFFEYNVYLLDTLIGASFPLFQMNNSDRWGKDDYLSHTRCLFRLWGFHCDSSNKRLGQKRITICSN